LRGSLSGADGYQTVVDGEGASAEFNMGPGRIRGGEVTKITVTDATNKTVADYQLVRGLPVASIHIVPEGFQEPLTFRFTVPTKTLEVAIPFEFKNLPIQR
jgi:hypothetical protein